MHISTVGGESLDNVREISINQRRTKSTCQTSLHSQSHSPTEFFNFHFEPSSSAYKFWLQFYNFCKKLKYFDILLNDLAFQPLALSVLEYLVRVPFHPWHKCLKLTYLLLLAQLLLSPTPAHRRVSRQSVNRPLFPLSHALSLISSMVILVHIDFIYHFSLTVNS